MSISNDPTFALMGKRLQETLGDDALKDRLAKIRNSSTWKRMEHFLALRREQLYLDHPQTTEQLWKREGALAEIQRLLLHGPTLVLQWQQWQAGETTTVSSPLDLPVPKSTDDGLG